MRKSSAAGQKAGRIMNRIRSLAGQDTALDLRRLNELIDGAIEGLESDSREVRPRSSDGKPGGLVRVKSPWTLIVPDLHARGDLLVDLLESRLPARPGTRIIELIIQGQLSMICLGDIPHSEGKQAAMRWSKAGEYALANPDKDHGENPYLREEMSLSMHALALVMSLKIELGNGFHCLKGNHDNLGNLEDGGDFPFHKYGMEGILGAGWFFSVYGAKAMEKIRRYERLLPLVACGRTYCASHAEPAFPLGYGDILNYGSRPEVVQALIWTDNGDALSGAARQCLKALLYPDQAEESLGSKPSSSTMAWAGELRWIAGHRPVSGAYALRAEGRVVQIHNPQRRQAAWVDDAQGESAGTMDIVEIVQGKSILRQSAQIRTPLGLDHGAGRD